MFRFLFIAFILTITTAVSGQELGKINNGKHSLKLMKNAHEFSLIYSDVSDDEALEKSFNFIDINKLYNILIDGFNEKDHQVYIQANRDTIIKLSYRRMKGEWMVMIKQDNMDTNTKGHSTFFSKESIEELFSRP